MGDASEAPVPALFREPHRQFFNGPSFDWLVVTRRNSDLGSSGRLGETEAVSRLLAALLYGQTRLFAYVGPGPSCLTGKSALAV